MCFVQDASVSILPCGDPSFGVQHDGLPAHRPVVGEAHGNAALLSHHDCPHNAGKCLLPHHIPSMGLCVSIPHILLHASCLYRDAWENHRLHLTRIAADGAENLLLHRIVPGMGPCVTTPEICMHDISPLRGMRGRCTSRISYSCS